MAHHQDVGMHGVQRHRRIHQGLALADRGRGHGHVHHVGAEALAGELERRLCSRGGLEEQIDLGAPPKIGALLVDLSIQLDIFFSEIQEAGDVGGGKPFDAQQMPVPEDKRRF